MPTPLSPDFSVSPQIAADEVAEIAARGFRSIMCNRPDGEEPGQPGVAEIAAAARAAGLEFAHVPIVSGAPISPADLAAFRAAIEALPGPVFAYCRSGTRSGNLWRLSQAR